MGNSEDIQEEVSLSEESIQSQMTEVTVNTTEVTVGNERIQVLNDASSMKLQVTPLHMKENRKKLSENKLIELFEKASKNCFSRFDLMSLALAYEHKLDDTYNVGIMVA